VVPLVGIPTTNYLTRTHYEEKYDLYDKKYRAAVQFIEHHIPRGEHNLYAREFDDKTDTTKPVIILMHGFPDSLHIYDRLAPQLADQYRVVSFDFLGWGRSDKPRKHTYDTASLYQDLQAVIDFLGAENVSLVVHDASGPPGIDWALNHPNRTTTLVLLNTYYHPMDALVKPEAIATFSTPGIRRSITRTGARISNYGFKSGFQSQLGRFFHDKKQAEVMLPVLTHQAMDIRRAFFQLNDVLDEELLARRGGDSLLNAYQGPVLVIFGNEDPYLNKDVARQFHTVFPNSSLNLIDQAAHFVQLDKPNVVAETILAGADTAR
jgi:pimeloyl-ACP methyl ester carboxylesterase